MKTTFSRTLSTTVIILLMALILVGTSFQALVKDYLTKNTFSELEQNGNIISSLASAYHSDSMLDVREFMVNLDIAGQVSGADLAIFSKDGRLVLCSDAITGCDGIPRSAPLRLAS